MEQVLKVLFYAVVFGAAFIGLPTAVVMYLREKKASRASSQEPMSQTEESEELLEARMHTAVQQELLEGTAIERSVATNKLAAMEKYQKAAKAEQEALNVELHVQGKKKGLFDNQVETERSRRAYLEALTEAQELEMLGAVQEKLTATYRSQGQKKENRENRWKGMIWFWSAVIATWITFAILASILK